MESCPHHSGVAARLEDKERRMSELSSKLNALTCWIMGIAGGVILSLLLLVVNLVLNLRKVT